MGSDMAMERISVSTYGKWEMMDDTQVFVIYQRTSYDNKEKQLWIGTEEDVNNSRALIQIIVGDVPNKPVPEYSIRKRIYDYLIMQSFCDGRGDPLDINTVNEVADELAEIVED